MAVILTPITQGFEYRFVSAILAIPLQERSLDARPLGGGSMQYQIMAPKGDFIPFSVFLQESFL